jgi:hypothetical protein
LGGGVATRMAYKPVISIRWVVVADVAGTWRAGQNLASPSWAFKLGPAEWESFVREAVSRFGYGSSFWTGFANPKPVPAWEVWNEPNLPENGPEETHVDASAYGGSLALTRYPSLMAETTAPHEMPPIAHDRTRFSSMHSSGEGRLRVGIVIETSCAHREPAIRLARHCGSLKWGGGRPTLEPSVGRAAKIY